MAVRTLRLESDPLLRKISKPVREMTPRINDLIDDMMETMAAEEGVGLAAPQVGVLRRIFITLVEDVVTVFINPEILSEDGRTYEVEGCLSLPGQCGIVRRPETLRIRALDREMKPFEVTLSGFAARVFCHENDHLNGVLYKDRAIIMNDDVYDLTDEGELEHYLEACYEKDL
ncbi:MAG: peptide deformylase [Eubacteriales bacterium]|nr:peptide deformylase [Eubacteriales bacterium]